MGEPRYYSLNIDRAFCEPLRKLSYQENTPVTKLISEAVQMLLASREKAKDER